MVTDPDGVRAVIGVTGQFSAVDNLLTGAENLQLMADLRHLGRQAGRQRVTDLLEQFDLADAADKPLSTYSGGMRRRLDLAMTLVGRPQVIFLDEPTTGLDPRSRRTMWQIIRELAAADVTILLTTQYLDEADRLADRIAVLDQGRIVAEGTPAELKSRIPGGHIRLHFAGPDLLRTAADLLPAAAPDQEQLALQVPRRHVDSLRDLLDVLHAARIDVERLSIHTPDLDDVFLAVTGSHVTGPAPTETPCREESCSDDHARLHHQRLADDAAPQPEAPAPVPLHDPDAGRPADRVPPAVRVRLRRPARRRSRPPDGRSAYLDYVVPGVLLIAVASAVQGTSIMVAMDMTGGIIDRFRTMAIARASVLTGHVLGSLIQTLAGIAVLVGVAFGLGFRTSAGPLEWLAAIGLLALFALALVWLAVALGLAAKSVETASNTPMFLTLLPFLGSGFVPTHTAMPAGLRQFAEYQPFTPVADTVRGLLTGAGIGDHAVVAVVWSICIALASCLWATRLYNNRRAAEPKSGGRSHTVHERRRHIRQRANLDLFQGLGGGEGTRTLEPLDCQSSALPTELRPRGRGQRLSARPGPSAEARGTQRPGSDAGEVGRDGVPRSVESEDARVPMTYRRSSGSGRSAGPTSTSTRSTWTSRARPSTCCACTPTRAGRPTRATSATTPSAT